MYTREQHKWFLVAAALVVLAAVLYCSWPLGFWLNPVATKTGLASELGAFKQPYNWFFIWADIISGIFLASASVLLAKLFHADGWRKAGLWMLAIYGLCGALDAALPMSCLPSEQVCGPIFRDPMLIVHGVIDITGSLALIGTLVAEWLYVKKHHPSWLVWIYVIGGGGVLFGVLSGIFLITHGPGFWAQRYYITLSCVWVMSMPFVLRPRRAILLEH